MTHNPENNKFEVIERFFLKSDKILDEQIVPLYDLEAIGGVIPSFVDDYIPIEEIRMPNMPKCDGAIWVKGDSMDPPIKAGDIICYKITQSRRGGLFFGEVYLLAYTLDGEEFVIVKRVFESDEPGYYRLESNNPDYDPIEVPRDSVRTMAMVKTVIRYLDF